MLDRMPRLAAKDHDVLEATLVDKETGEVHRFAGQMQTIAAPEPGRPHRRRGREHQMFVLLDTHRIRQLELTRQEHRVFWCVVDHLQKESGRSRITTGEIIEQCGMHPSNTKAALGSLRRRQLVIRERNGVWVVNPWLLYAGSAADWETDTAEYPEPEWSRA